MHTQAQTRARTSRRRFLRSLASGGLLLGAASLTGARTVLAGDATGSTFVRMFPQLPPFAPPTPRLAEALLDLGRAGGAMDARDPLSAGPVALIVDPELSRGNPDAASPTASPGLTFVGQFVDHDVTFDASSRLGVPTAPRRVPNVRLPALDLDSVYGRGPVADSHLYDSGDPAKLRVESGGQFEDLPRTSDGTALIADPRNDENLMIAGLHAAFLLFHNRLVDQVRAEGTQDPLAAFARARRLTTWHYQWIVLHELLPAFVGQTLVDEVLWRGPRGPSRDEPMTAIPVEFQGAAYRFAHSVVRPSYRANLRGDRGGAFFGMVFDPAVEGQPDPGDMRGGCRAARRFIGWQTFFDFGDGEVRRRKVIDTRISTPLFRLPLRAIADGSLPISLPQRNLLRHVTWQLPSGQRIAQEYALPALAPADFPELREYGLGLESSTPLWYYILREAWLATRGERLGPVGAQIVAEVVIGLLKSDANSWVAAAPDWRPTVPSRSGEFRTVDLLTFARVDPASRGQ